MRAKKVESSPTAPQPDCSSLIHLKVTGRKPWNDSSLASRRCRRHDRPTFGAHVVKRRHRQPHAPPQPADQAPARASAAPAVRFKWPSLARSALIRVAIFATTVLFLMPTGFDIGLNNDAPGWVIPPSQKEGVWIMDLLHGRWDKILDKAYTAEMWTVPFRDFKDQTQPPFARTCLWIGWKLTGRWLGMIHGYRFGAACLSGMFLAILLPWMARRYGWFAATATGLMILLSPRVFYEAQLLYWDMPASILIVLATLAFHRGVTSGRWNLFFVCFGLGFITKLTALFFLPPPLLLWGWWALKRDRTLKPPNPFRFIIQWAVVSGALIVLLWPDLWRDPLGRLAAYFYQFTSVRGSATYFGERFAPLSPQDIERYVAPWHYPFVMILVTTPLPVLALLAAGLAKVFRDWRKDIVLPLLALSGLIPVLMVAAGGGYSGIRPFLSSMLLFAMLAGIGLGHLAEITGVLLPRLRQPPFVLAVFKGAVLVALASSLVFSMRTVFPHVNIYYNAVPGGARRAIHDYGMESTYWTSFLNPRFCAYLNMNAPPNARLSFLGMINGSLSYYQHDGVLRDDIRVIGMWAVANPPPLNAVLAAEYHAVGTYEILNSWHQLQPNFCEVLDANVEPVYRDEPAGVPVLRLYRRDDLIAAMRDTGGDWVPVRADLGGVSIEGARLAPPHAQIQAGGKTYAEFLVRVVSTNAPLPLNVTLLAPSGEPAEFDDPQRAR
ncbi:MAG: hypothetical protein FJ278_09425, partial [Planctomycetes bacterium]|nr:hypothetical protein [Planctomycetota bacterium]